VPSQPSLPRSVAGFLWRLYRDAPSKRRLLQSLALGSRGGDLEIVSADGTSLSARQTGQGDPVVLVHGTLDGIGAFAFVELTFAERHTVWVYDRRGRGGSGDAASYALEREVEDLGAVLAEAGPAHVVAHSYGGIVALHAAATGVPMRSLVLYEPPVNGDAIRPSQAEAVEDAVRRGQLDEAIRRMSTGIAGITQDEVRVGLSIPVVRARLRDGVRTAGREVAALRSLGWAGTELPLTTTPVLVLRGGATQAPVYPRLDQIPDLAIGAEIVTFDGQGHLAHTFAPTTFANTVLGFVGHN
jgi:pimeloyl-ACP methyl ester carboxylesterase